MIYWLISFFFEQTLDSLLLSPCVSLTYYPQLGGSYSVTSKEMMHLRACVHLPCPIDKTRPYSVDPPTLQLTSCRWYLLGPSNLTWLSNNMPLCNPIHMCLCSFTNFLFNSQNFLFSFNWDVFIKVDTIFLIVDLLGRGNAVVFQDLH